jgi:hypothetical protein
LVSGVPNRRPRAKVRRSIAGVAPLPMTKAMPT